MKICTENLTESFVLPAELDSSKRHQLGSIQVGQDGLLIQLDEFFKTVLMEKLFCNEIILFASGIKFHLQLNVLIVVPWIQDLDCPRIQIKNLLS